MPVWVRTPFLAIETPSVPRVPIVLSVPFVPSLRRPQLLRRCHPLHNEPTDSPFLPPSSRPFRSSCHHSCTSLTRKGRVKQGMQAAVPSSHRAILIGRWVVLYTHCQFTFSERNFIFQSLWAHQGVLRPIQTHIWLERYGLAQEPHKKTFRPMATKLPIFQHFVCQKPATYLIEWQPIDRENGPQW